MLGFVCAAFDATVGASESERLPQQSTCQDMAPKADSGGVRPSVKLWMCILYGLAKLPVKVCRCCKRLGDAQRPLDRNMNN